jgi:hypothetical protein
MHQQTVGLVQLFQVTMMMMMMMMVSGGFAQ